MSKRKFGLFRSFSSIVAILLLVLAFGAILKFTQIGDKITDLFDPSFRVEYNGVDYKGDANKISLPKGKQAHFKVKGVNGYTVTIAPNVTADTDFTYTVDGVPHKFSEANLYKAFISRENVQNGLFTLNALDDYSLKSVLSKVYDGQTVLVHNNTIRYGYLLTIISGEQSIQFLVESVLEISEISLDHTQIVF